jgi:hypothetical protein
MQEQASNTPDHGTSKNWACRVGRFPRVIGEFHAVSSPRREKYHKHAGGMLHRLGLPIAIQAGSCGQLDRIIPRRVFTSTDASTLCREHAGGIQVNKEDEDVGLPATWEKHEHCIGNITRQHMYSSLNQELSVKVVAVRDAET